MKKWPSIDHVERYARRGQGKAECIKSRYCFPKLVFLYDESLHGPGGELEDVFEAGIECSRHTMYPDWLSLTGKGYIASYVQAIWEDHQSDGLPCVSYLLGMREAACIRRMKMIRPRICGTVQYRRGQPASSDDLSKGQT